MVPHPWRFGFFNNGAGPAERAGNDFLRDLLILKPDNQSAFVLKTRTFLPFVFYGYPTYSPGMTSSGLSGTRPLKARDHVKQFNAESISAQHLSQQTPWPGWNGPNRRCR